MHRLTGRYECRQRDSGGQTWRLLTVNRPYGSWLRLDATYPAQNGQPAGSYYTRYSTSRDFNGSQWIDGDPADGGKAVVKVISSAEYTFDFASPTGPGKTARSHTVCTKT
ncbi:MAG TPA: hypothetical protein VGZ06_07300 [Candidatus Cybelea sp.]|nr:hypothetical protein [Candidatus Cybelea sp.]